MEWDVERWMLNVNSPRCDRILESYESVLDDTELQRRNRFTVKEHRRRFSLTRILCRCVLSYYHANVVPGHWRFSTNSFGKPGIANGIANPVRFNLSHSGDYIVMAVTSDAKVGVDIEQIKLNARRLNIADNFFSEPEKIWIFEATDEAKIMRFYQLWTLKEAFMKALGVGLAIPLDSFAIIMMPTGNIEVELIYPNEHLADCRLDHWHLTSHLSEKFALATVYHSLQRFVRISPLQNAEALFH